MRQNKIPQVAIDAAADTFLKMVDTDREVASAFALAMLKAAWPAIAEHQKAAILADRDYMMPLVRREILSVRDDYKEGSEIWLALNGTIGAIQAAFAQKPVAGGE